MPAFELPYSIKVTNPVPVDYLSGPYIASDVSSAKALANSGITHSLRFKSLEVRLIVAGSSKKYWYQDGIEDTDLVEVSQATVWSLTGSNIINNNSGSVLIGTASVDTNDRLVVSSISGTASLVVDNDGSVYNKSKGENTLFGYQTLYSNTTGSYSVAIGYRALYSNTTGSYNSALGDTPLYSNTTGGYNSALGNASLQFNTTGSYNTGYGAYSLYYNTTGSYNTAVGYASLYNTSTGVSTFALSNPGSGYTASTTFSNVQLSYISGSTASTYPTVDVYVGSTGSVSMVTLVTTGTGFIDTTTVMGTNLGSSATFSINVTTISTGISNTAIGSGSLYSNTIGSSNTAVGLNSLYSNSTGTNNVAVGRSSLYSNTIGFSNTAVGRISLYLNTTGNYNTVFGIQSMYYNTIGSTNTAIGVSTLLSNTTGSYSTAVGYLTLRASTTVVSVLGSISPGNGYTSGTWSDVQLTYSSGSTATTYPKATIVIGVGGTVSSVTLSTTSRGTGFKDITTIMSVDTSSVGGTGSGFTVGVSTILAASGNTALGHQALLYNITGSSNISIGFNSMNTNSTGSQNVAIGGNALFFNTTGSQNTAIGFNSSYNNTTGTNTALGYQSLYWNTTGTNNSALGYQSLYWNTSGIGNVGVGHQSLFNATASSSNNTAIGYQSLFSILENSNNNTALGYHAGHYITSGVVSATLSNWSTYIGSYTRGYVYDTTHEVVIGASAIGNGSYSVTIGNDSITKTILKGNIGVGIALPSTKLHIYGTQSGAFRLEDGTQGLNKVLVSDTNGVASWTSSTSTFYVQGGTTYSSDTTSNIYRTGSLNIGTATANGRLVVASSGGTMSLIVTEEGFVYNRDKNGILTNLAIGLSASAKNTTGLSNTAFGNGALLSNTNKSYNVAIGFNTLYNSNADYNVAIGESSLYNNTIGTQNNAIGGFALYYNVGGSYNTAIGVASMQNGTQSQRNTGIGGYSLYNTTGSRNIGIGFFGGSGITTGSDNVVIGSDPNNNTDGLTTGSNNTIMGKVVTGIRVGDNNTILGRVSGLASGLTNSVIISDGSGNIRLYVNSSGNFGLGTVSPSTKLHIFATQSGAFRLEDGTQSYPGYVLTSDANGVGTWQGNTQITLSGPTATALASWNNTTVMSNFSATCSITIPDTGLPPNFSFRFIIISGNNSATITFATASLSQILPNTLLTFAQYESGVIDRYGTTQNYYITY